jgi:biotin carboxyl carrier protein
MKMESKILAHKDGIVKQLYVKEGSVVEGGSTLLILE